MPAADRRISQSFSEQGFAILPSAVDGEAIDKYLAALRTAEPERLMLIDHETGVRSYHSREDGARLLVPLNRLTETHWAVAEARGLFSSPIVTFLQQALDSSQLLCFETFHHEVGLAMRMHREGWYVRLRDGGPLVTVWIALADLAKGGGEPQYSPGSHRLNGYEDPRLADAAAHEQIVNRFGLECVANGIERFAGRKGDVLITRGDVGVGGDPVADECRMFVAHFCALRDEPAYFAALAPEFRVKRQFTRELYSSTVYAGKY